MEKSRILFGGFFNLKKIKSCAPGKAGGLNCEPLKAAEYLILLKADGYFNRLN